MQEKHLIEPDEKLLYTLTEGHRTVLMSGLRLVQYHVTTCVRS